MMRYLAGRLLRALLTIFLVVTFAFFVLRLSGDPALLIMSVDAPPESVEAFRKSWGLDQPIWMQYLAYIVHALHGDLGKSMRDGRAAIELVLGARAGHARHHRAGLRAEDRRSACRPASTPRCTAIPSPTASPWCCRWRGSPCRASCWRCCWCWSSRCSSAGCRQRQRGHGHAILPIVTLGAAGAAILARFTRSAMLEVLGQPYIRAASAKGVSWRAGGDRGHALAQCRDPDHHHRRLHGRHPDRRRRGGRKRVLLARHRTPAGRLGGQPRSRRRADHPAVCRRDHGDGQHHRRSLRPDRLRPDACDDRDPQPRRPSSAAAAPAFSKRGRRSPWQHSPGSR